MLLRIVLIPRLVFPLPFRRTFVPLARKLGIQNRMVPRIERLTFLGVASETQTRSNQKSLRRGNKTDTGVRGLGEGLKGGLLFLLTVAQS